MDPNSGCRMNDEIVMEGAVGGVHTGSPEAVRRPRRLTERGLQYNVDIKLESLDRCFKRLKSKSIKLTDLMDSGSPVKIIQPVYSEWLSLYEEFLTGYDKITDMVYGHNFPHQTQHMDGMYKFLQTVKGSVEKWFADNNLIKQKCEEITPDDSVTKVSKSSSLRSSLASARLKEAKKKAELLARASLLKEKQTLERENLRLKLEAEELEIKTELVVVEATSKVIDSFEQASSRNTGVNDSASGKVKTQNNDNEHTFVNAQNVVLKSVLNPQSKPFTVTNPVHAHTNAYSYDERNDSVFNAHDVTSSLHNAPNLASDFYQSAQLVNPLNSRTQNEAVNRNFDTCVTGNDTLDTGNEIHNGNTPEHVIQSVVRQLRKPVPEIKKFSGDVLEYRKFLRQFTTKIVSNTDSDYERMNYLEQFTTGEAAKVVSGYSYLSAESGYQAAMLELEERYGRDDIVAHAFVKKALDWPQVKSDSAKGLDDFSLFLAECGNAVSCIDAARVLEYPDNLKRLVAKLPFYLHDKWRNTVQYCRMKGELVKFQTLVKFVKDEARKATDPTFGKDAMSVHIAPGKFQRKTPKVATKPVFATKSSESREINITSKNPVSNSVKSQVQKLCDYCKKEHLFSVCDSFRALPMQDRVDYIKRKGYCFGCMKYGHMKRDCKNKSVCLKCKGCHPTSLHADMSDNAQNENIKSNESSAVKIFSNFSQQVDSNTGAGTGECTMAVIPVRVRIKNSGNSICTYAFLDPGSSVSFCSEQLRTQLGIEGSKMRITLDTMAEPYTMSTRIITGLEIGDLSFQNVIAMPKVYTKDRIPVDKALIPTKQDILNWPHLADLDLPVINSDIGLLIGNNIPDAYVPVDLHTGPRGCPYASLTILGWIIWGLVRSQSLSAYSNVFPVNKADILAVEKVNENASLESLVRKAINRDFPERIVDEVKEPSREDKRFLDIMDTSMTLVNGHYQVGLPFRDPNVKLPDNIDLVKRRLVSLKRKMEKNPQFHKDYVDFINQILDSGYAEIVPENDLDRNDGRVWYLPHHGVYHPRKPGKMRVVFDCAAQFYGVSINSLLLQGPDLTNSLLAVLLRFRQGSVAIMGDIVSMFHQVRLPKEDCDCFRFMWWPEGDLNTEPVIYRMLVHLFGATSSPSCCNAALRRTASDHQGEFSDSITNVLVKSFYVDDCLNSADSVEEAVEILKGVSELCRRGGFELSKWSSNSPEVLQSVPVDNRAKDIKSLDLQKDALPNERALGVHWSVQTDTFGFDIQFQSKPATRRGILSITSSVYDPLGLAAPFTLLGKQLLQDLCKRGVDWDEQICEKDQLRWERWIADLPRLQTLSLPRCYKPPDFGAVAQCELHVFSAASEKGYGTVAYLRLINHHDQIHCSFVFAKARVIPLKKVTIPRLELTAATVSAKISVVITRELEYQINRVIFWTDSMSVIRYIQSETGRFHTFVANRHWAK